jgi:predicted GNAT family acetyltransferase
VASEVRRDDERSRYELWFQGRMIGVADYQRVNGHLVFPHTEIDAAHRGQGFGEVLVRGALDDVRARGERIEPRCWYVRQFVDEHPEYADLVADGTRRTG